MKTRSWLVERFGAKVILQVFADADFSEKYLSPYFRITDYDGSTNGDIWHVSTSPDEVNVDPLFQRQQTKIRNEPVRTIWYNVPQRRIIVQAAERIWLDIFCCRIVRDLIRWQLFPRSIFLQGSLVEVAKRGVAIVGPPKSGKTSTVLALLCKQRNTFVAENDLSLLRSENDLTELACGWPRSLCIRSNMLSALELVCPTIVRMAAALTHPYNGHKTDTNEIVHHIMPRELSVLTNCKIKSDCTLDFFVFPRWSNVNKGHPSLKQLTRTEAELAIMSVWDFLPERMLGMPSAQMLDSRISLDRLCFNPFLAKASLIPSWEQFLPRIHQLAIQIPSFTLHQTPFQLEESAELIANAMKEFN